MPNDAGHRIDVSTPSAGLVTQLLDIENVGDQTAAMPATFAIGAHMLDLSPSTLGTSASPSGGRLA